MGQLKVVAKVGTKAGMGKQVVDLRGCSPGDQPSQQQMFHWMGSMNDVAERLDKEWARNGKLLLDGGDGKLQYKYVNIAPRGSLPK